KSFGDRPGISWGTSVHSTYAQWAKQAAAIAGSLAALTPDDSGARIAIIMSNRPEYLEALFAIWHAGRVAVPINAKLHREEFRYILAHSGARLCITSPDLAATIAPLAGELPALERVIVTDDEVWRRWRAADGIPLVDCAPNAPAWLFYTSGTTGRPKGATLTHRNLLFASMAYYADIDFLDEHGALIHAAPMSHGSGLYGLPHINRGAAHVIPESGRLDPA